MHDCQSYRENWLAGTAGKVTDCDACRSFCDEADVILQATAGATQPIPEFSEEYWSGLDNRLRATLVQENASRTSRAYWKWSAVAAAAIAIVVTWSTIPPAPPATPKIEVVDAHIQGLDPMVVSFLERSELYLRNFTKIDPTYVEDLEDSRSRAKQSLNEIAGQKELTGNFAPVRITLDEYENVLREIKNLDSRDELVDLQARILANGLIANMKAYQPQVVLLSQR